MNTETPKPRLGKPSKSEVTPEVIQGWKQKYSDVFQLSVEDSNGNVKVGFFRKPSRQVLGNATKHLQASPMKYQEILLNNCFLGGDPEILTDDDCFLAVGVKFEEVIAIKDADLKKL